MKTLFFISLLVTSLFTTALIAEEEATSDEKAVTEYSKTKQDDKTHTEKKEEKKDDKKAEEPKSPHTFSANVSLVGKEKRISARISAYSF